MKKKFKWPKFLTVKRTILFALLLFVIIFALVYFFGGYKASALSSDLMEFNPDGFVHIDQYIEDEEAKNQEAFDKLYKEWEDKCEDLIKEIEADNLEDEADIVAMIEDIYELRKSGISEGEYSIQNLVFKELRNNKYLDGLKEYKDKLIAKRLSL